MLWECSEVRLYLTHSTQIVASAAASTVFCFSWSEIRGSRPEFLEACWQMGPSALNNFEVAVSWQIKLVKSLWAENAALLGPLNKDLEAGDTELETRLGARTRNHAASHERTNIDHVRWWKLNTTSHTVEVWRKGRCLFSWMWPAIGDLDLRDLNILMKFF